MNYKILTVTFLLLVNLFIYGQDSTGIIPGNSFHTVGISAGINQIKEENLLPLVHTGYIVNILYEYQNIKKSYQNIQLILGIGRVVADPEDITKSVNFLIKPSYSFCFNLVRKSGFNFFLGPQAGGSYSLSYYPSWDDSHVYWADFISLGSTAFGQYILTEDRRFQFQLSIPLISFYSRPESLRLFKADHSSFGEILRSSYSNIKAGLWDAVFAIRLCVEYQFPVFRTKTEAFSYTLEYTRVKADGGNPFQQLIHQLGLKVLL